PVRHAHYRITNVPERPPRFPAVDLEIRDHGVHDRIPIDQPLVAVDQPFPIQLHENSAHRSRQSRIHREPLAAPIRRRAEAAQLAGNRSARLLLPLPYALDELLTPDFALGSTFGG